MPWRQVWPLLVLLNVFGQRRVAAVAFAGIAVLLFLFKVSGLYDRDELRLVHSTLDEAPLLVQVTGLFALGSRSFSRSCSRAA